MGSSLWSLYASKGWLTNGFVRQNELLREQARAGDILAAAEFMEEPEAIRACCVWLRNEDDHEFATYHWESLIDHGVWEVFHLRVLNLKGSDIKGLHPERVLVIVRAPAHWEIRVLCGAGSGFLHMALTLPALCRWIRANLTALRFNEVKQTPYPS